MIVYQHKKETTGEVFYVGITHDRYKHKRPNTTHGRSKLWKNVAKKHGWYSEILFKDLSVKEAKQIERYLIGYYGRICENNGVLANITDGGESKVGYVTSADTKNKLSKAASKRHATGVYKKHKGNRFRCKLTLEQEEYIKQNWKPYNKEFGTNAMASLFNVSVDAIYRITKNL